MPLYEIAPNAELIPFRRLRGGPELYEREIEDLLWANLEEFVGEPLFAVARQPSIGGGGRPDIVSLDRSGRVVVIEVKRDIDRGQLAQCLEYAGWARGAGLDQLAAIYHGGVGSFFDDWRSFTESETLQIVNPRPRLILVARAFHGRTASALEFLVENRLPVELFPVAVYEDQQGRRFVDIEAEHESEVPLAVAADGRPPVARHEITIEGRRVRIADLLEANLLEVGDELRWRRRAESHRATVSENGAVRLEDGREFAAPSRAAREVAGGQGQYDGWKLWTVPRLQNVTLEELRSRLVELRSEEDDAE
jgi:Restriction Enzyme Adenine Methylase Associated/Archaeal holliday junction resolvase (hjc)